MERSAPIKAWRRYLPLAALMLVSVAGIVVLYRFTGGRQLADDFNNLRNFVMNPLVLWGDYGASGISRTWGSFPPLLPLIFGLPVRPWFAFLPDFIAFRIGVLVWTAVVYLLTSWVAGSVPGIDESRRRFLLTAFVLLPTVLFTIVVIPQEEIYVAVFSIILFVAGIKRKWGMMPFLLILTALSAKYFLLVLIIPLAFASGRPARNMALWGGSVAVVLAVYVLYHRLAFGLTPIIDHVVPYDSSLSAWALLWNLGLRLDPATVKVLALPVLGAAVLATGMAADRKGLPLQHSFALTLFVTLTLLSITFPGYILWNVPFVLICAATAGTSRARLMILLGTFLYGVGEIGSNFFRGVHLALSAERSAAKSAVASTATRLLGEDFPWHAFHTAFLILVLSSTVFTAWMIWREGTRKSPVNHA